MRGGPEGELVPGAVPDTPGSPYNRKVRSGEPTLLYLIMVSSWDGARRWSVDALEP